MPATPNEALLDVNVLIAAIFADHPAHDFARPFVDNLQRFHASPTPADASFPNILVLHQSEMTSEHRNCIPRTTRELTAPLCASASLRDAILRLGNES